MCKLYQEIAATLIYQLGERATDPLEPVDLANISKIIVDPFSLAPYLDISDAEIVVIKRDHVGDFKAQKYELFSLWKRKNGCKATLSILIPILCNMQWQHEAEKICQRKYE